MSLPPKKKILFICHDPGTDGAQLSLYLILKNLDRERYQAYVTMHRPGPLMEMVEALGWPIIRLNRMRILKGKPATLADRLNWRMLHWTRGRQLARLIERERIDLVHTNTMMSYEGAYAAHQTGRPHIWHIREYLPGNEKLYGLFGTEGTLNLVPRYAQKVVCVSDTVKQQFPMLQAQPDKFMTVYNGVDPVHFSPQAVIQPEHEIRRRYGIGPDTPLFTYVGRICKQKGFTDLVNACDSLKRQQVDFKLMVLGEAIEQPYWEQIQQTIAALGLAETVYFLGRQSQAVLPQYLSQMDGFVTASYDEPFARSVLEAMAMTLPVVGVDSGGTPESVRHGETGLIVKTGEVPALAEAMRALSQNPGMRREFGQKGRQRVQDSFTIERYIANIHGLYEHILQ